MSSICLPTIIIVMPHHVLFNIKPKEKNFNKEEAEGLCQNYLVTTLAGSNCTFDGHTSKCSCLTFLAEESNATAAEDIAAYMVHWASFDSKTKRELLYQWGRFASHIDGQKAQRYVIPQLVKDDYGDGGVQEKRLVCRTALLNILNLSLIHI